MRKVAALLDRACEGLEFRVCPVEGFGVRAQGSGFGVQGLGLRVWGLGFRV